MLFEIVKLLPVAVSVKNKRRMGRNWNSIVNHLQRKNKEYGLSYINKNEELFHAKNVKRDYN